MRKKKQRLEVVRGVHGNSQCVFRTPNEPNPPSESARRVSTPSILSTGGEPSILLTGGEWRGMADLLCCLVRTPPAGLSAVV